MRTTQNIGSRRKIEERGNTSKSPPRADTNRASHDKKRKVGESASPTNPKTVHSGNRRTINAGHPSNLLNEGKTCLFNGPGHSTKECKVLKVYFIKYAKLWLSNAREAHSGGTRKRDKTVQFYGTTEEVNVVTACDSPIPRKIRESSGKET